MDLMPLAKAVASRPGKRSARWGAKINEVDASEIRAAIATGGIMQVELAERYGVSQTLISLIKHGHRWERK